MYRYTVIDLGGLAPGYGCSPARINAAGRATGLAYLPMAQRWDAMLTSGTNAPVLTDLGLLMGSTSTQGTDLNASADVVGSALADALQRAVLWSGGQGTDLHPLVAPWGLKESGANGINDQGDVVGDAWTLPPNPNDPETQVGWLYRNGQMQNLSGTVDQRIASAQDINNGGQIVGGTTDAPGGYIYDTQGFALIPSGAFPEIHINESGLVAGYDQNNFFTWQRGQANVNNFYTTLTVYDAVYDVNNIGQMVGRVATKLDGSDAHGFIYDGGNLIDINGTLVNSPGWYVDATTSINDAGWIVGTGKQGGGAERGLLLAPNRELTPLNLGLVARILFGVSNDAGGIVVIGDRPVPVPPLGPNFIDQLPPAERDLLLAFSINELAALIGAPGARSAIQSAATALMLDVVPRLNAPQAGGAGANVFAAIRSGQPGLSPYGKRRGRRPSRKT